MNLDSQSSSGKRSLPPQLESPSNALLLQLPAIAPPICARRTLRWSTASTGKITSAVTSTPSNAIPRTSLGHASARPARRITSSCRLASHLEWLRSKKALCGNLRQPQIPFWVLRPLLASFPAMLFAATNSPYDGHQSEEFIEYAGLALPSGIPSVAINMPLIDVEPYRILPPLAHSQANEEGGNLAIRDVQNEARSQERCHAPAIEDEQGNDYEGYVHVGRNGGWESGRPRHRYLPARTSSQGSSASSSSCLGRLHDNGAYSTEDDDSDGDEDQQLRDALRRSADKYADRLREEERAIAERSAREYITWDEELEEEERRRTVGESGGEVKALKEAREEEQQRLA
ncbi:hypothetical protein B0J12DRAFT_725208, partial [Macrophomina phaseolina]